MQQKSPTGCGSQSGVLKRGNSLGEELLEECQDQCREGDEGRDSEENSRTHKIRWIGGRGLFGSRLGRDDRLGGFIIG